MAQRRFPLGVGQTDIANRAEQVVCNDRQHHVQLEVAGLPGNCDRGVVADHLCGNHFGRFGNYRVDLARHDRRAGRERLELDLGKARQRTGVRTAQVVDDLHQRYGSGLQGHG